MEDFEIAPYVFSLLLKTEVKVLNFLATEFSQSKSIADEHTLETRRLDFVAEIKTDLGRKKVILELQKSYCFSSMVRFSDYLGQQYSKRKKFSKEEKDIEETSSENLPIMPIYFLSKNINAVDAMFSRVKRHIYNIETGQEIPYHNNSQFIETLSHDMIIVQLSKIADKTWFKNETYTSLSPKEKEYHRKLRSFFKLFDQQLISEKNNYELLIDADELTNGDAGMNRAVSRLGGALADEQVRYGLRRQEEVEMFFTEMQVKAEELSKQKEQLSKQKEVLSKQNKELSKQKEELKEELLKKKVKLKIN